MNLDFETLWSPGNDENEEVLFSVQYDRASIAADPTELGSCQGGFFGSYLGGSERAGENPWKSYNLCPTMYMFEQYKEGDSRLDATIMKYIYVNYWDYYTKDDLNSTTIEYYYAPKGLQSDEHIQAWRDENPAQRSATEVIKYDNWEADKTIATNDFLYPVIKKF